MLALTIFAALVAGPVLPAPLPDTTLTFNTGAENFQQKPQVAFNGTDYFCVWEDTRHDGTSLPAIYCARINQAGKVKDSVGVAVSAVDQYDEHFPAVAFDGTNHLVVWQGRNPATGNQDLYGARVGPDGVVLDPGGFLVASAAGHQFFGCVAFNGTNYLVTWWDGRTGEGWLYCARVAPSGQVLDTAGVPICRRNNQNYPWGLSVAASHDDWLVVADEENGNSILAAVVKADGRVALVDSLAHRTGDSRWFPAADYDEQDSMFLVVWQDWRSGNPPEGNGVWACRVTHDGTVLDPGGFRVADDPARYEGLPSVSWNGRVFMVCFTENLGSPTYNDICGRRITPGGTVLDSTVSLRFSRCPYTEQFSDIVNNGSGWYVAWEDQRGSMDVAWGPDIYSTRVDSSGQALDVYPDDRVVSSSAPRQFKSALARHADEYLAVWQEFRGNNSWDIFGARFSASGAVIGEPFPVSAGPGNNLDPSVAAGNSCYLVSWQDEQGMGRIIGRRIGLDGAPLDTAVVISPDYINRYPQVAFDGSSFMAAYWEGNFPYEARGRRMAEDGTMGSEFTIADIGYQGGPGWNLHTSFGLAFAGANYLVIWPDWQTSASQYEIKGCRFTPAGSVLDPDGFFVTRTPSVDEDFPRLCFGAGRYFAVWHNMDVDDVYGSRIDTAGFSLDSLGIRISSGSGADQNPTVAFDGTNYLVVWSDGRNDIGDIYATRVSPSGTVLDPGGVAVIAAAERQSYPWVVQSPTSGTSLVAYSSFIDTAYSTSRVQVRNFASSGIVGSSSVAAAYGIGEARPNPFFGRTRLWYALEHGGDVRLDVFDASGRLVRSLEGNPGAGSHTVVWDGTDEAGQNVNAGVYYCRISGAGSGGAAKLLKLD